VTKLREKSIVHLGHVYAKLKDGAAIDGLLKELRPVFDSFSKAKAAKLVRTLIDTTSQIPDSIDLQVKMCQDSIAWTVEEKRTFLRHRLEVNKEIPLGLCCSSLTSVFFAADKAV